MLERSLSPGAGGISGAPELCGHLLVSPMWLCIPSPRQGPQGVWPGLEGSPRPEWQVISRAALTGEAAQRIAGFTSGTALGGSLRARREEVTAAAWLRSSKTAEGRKANKQQTAKERLIGRLPEGLVGVVFLVLTLANFYRIVNLELLPKWGDFRCVLLNKKTRAYLSSLTQRTGIPIGFITH